MRILQRSSRRWLVCLLASVLLTGSGLLAPVPPVPPEPPPVASDESFALVDAFLQDQIDSIGIPGAAVVVVRDGRQVHAAALGRADDSGRAMTIQTPVLLASTSKTLTTIAVMQQVEAGRLRLDEPVRTYLPWFTLKDSRSAAITVRHLLHQTSGMASTDTAFEASSAQGPAALEDSVRALSDSALAGTPGESFRYASANYNILGLLVQTVTNQPFGEYMEENVFGPLAMAHSHTARSAAEADNMAAGHSLWFGSFWRQTDVPAPAAGVPSSTMYASAEDLGRELIALLNKGRTGNGRILRPESVDALLERRTRVDDFTGYAMGWYTLSLSGSAGPANGALPMVEHQGEWGNSHTYVAMVPSSGIGFALVINGNDTSAPSRLRAIDANVLRILHGLPPEPAVLEEDWLQRYSWAVALALLLAELLSLFLALAVLRRRSAAARRPWRPLAGAVAALALDAFVLWLCFIYAPARFDTKLPVIVYQFPDVGITLVPALALALTWPFARTIWLLSEVRARSVSRSTAP